MKRKVIAVAGCFVIAIAGFVYWNVSNQSATNVNEEKTKATPEKKKKALATISIKEMTVEELYARFGYLEEETFDLLYGEKDEAATIVALKNGGTITGGAYIASPIDSESAIASVDSDDDANAITIKELKEILTTNQEKLFELDQIEKNKEQ